MSKKGKKQNKARRQGVSGNPANKGFPSWQAQLSPLREEQIPEVLEDPFRLFVLDAQDEPVPVHQGFPGALGMMLINCLRGDDTNVVSLGETLTFRKGSRDGWVHVELVEHDSHTPLLIAAELSPAMRKQLNAKAVTAAAKFMAEP